MVNGRSLDDELNRINEFFDSMDLEQFEQMAFECGAEMILPGKERIQIAKRYANLERKRKNNLDSVFDMTYSETEAA